jgi:RNA polymerase sigma-70 factor (ECF subfamily)
MAPRVHAFFYRAFRDECTADELMQTTFLKVHRARESYRRDLPFAPWLFAIAVHVRRDEWRRRFRLSETAGEEAISIADQEAAVDRANEAASAADRSSEIRAAISELPEIQRVVLQLHQYEGMTYAEIALALESSTGAVRQHAFRAYETLRKRLSPVLRKRTIVGRTA